MDSASCTMLKIVLSTCITAPFDDILMVGGGASGSPR